MRGAMIWFNEEKGHGFIKTEEGERLYVDAAGFLDGPPRGRCAGLPVEFDVVDQESREAIGCMLVGDEVPRRARLRRGGRSSA